MQLKSSLFKIDDRRLKWSTLLLTMVTLLFPKFLAEEDASITITEMVMRRSFADRFVRQQLRNATHAGLRSSSYQLPATNYQLAPHGQQAELHARPTLTYLTLTY